MARSTIEVGHPNVVSHGEWLAARREFLTKEKEFTRLRDELSRQRRSLPWEKVEKRHEFDSTKGKALADLFDDRNQLIVYHFMLAPDWEEGCKSCSFRADNFNGIPIHLNHRDVCCIRGRIRERSQFNREYSRFFGQPPMRDIRTLRSPGAPPFESVSNLQNAV